MYMDEYTRSVQKLYSHVIWKRDIYWRRYKIQDTLYIGQWRLSPLPSRHLGTSHSSPNYHQLPHRISLNHLNSFHREMLKLNAKVDAYLLLYSLSHSECDGHTVHMLTQRHLPTPLTSTVKSSLFTHAHSSPLSLAVRLHPCHANHSC